MTSIGSKKSTVWYAASQGIYGEITRDLYSAWTTRLGEDAKIVLEDKIQPLFNDIGLFPSKSQIFEMVHCARAGSLMKDRVNVKGDDSDLEDDETNHSDILPDEMESDSHADSGRNRPSDIESKPSKKSVDSESIGQSIHIHNYHLTLGEFCVFATELRRRYDQYERSEQELLNGDFLVCNKKDCAGRRTHKKCKCHYHHPYRPNHSKVGGSKAASRPNPDGNISSPSGSSSSSCSISPNIKKSAIRAQKSTSSTSAYDVFLGGSCNPTTWRHDTAIPHLKSQNITYYNPQQANWVPEMIELEHQAKQSSRVLLFVVANQTRNVSSMIEISYFAGGSVVKGRRLVTYLETYPGPGHRIQDEAISGQEFEDLTAGLITLHDLIERQGIPVFDSLDVALKCTTKVIRENLGVEELGLKDFAQPVKHAQLQVGDKIVRLKEAFASQDTQKIGKICLADIKLAFRIYTHSNLTTKDVRTIIKAHDSSSSRSSVSENGVSNSRSSSSGKDNIMFDFEHFCCIVSEFKPTKSEKQGGNGQNSSGKLKGKKLWSSLSRKVGYVCRSMLQPFGVANNDANGVDTNNYVKDATSGRNPMVTDSNGSAEASHYHLRRSPLPQLPRGRRGSSIRDVYLGGSYSFGESSWQEKDAIPVLKKNGLTFFLPPPSSMSFSKSKKLCNPPLTIGSDSCRKRLMPIEAARIDNSRVLLFVILGSSRSLSAMCEAAYHIGLGRGGIVLCVQQIPKDGKINSGNNDDGEILSPPALKDYNRGRKYLSDIANREKVPVFENISEALDCVVQKCKSDYPSSVAS